ncbi:beta-galactosidase [Paenibacillus sp. FSL R7-0273]|uniref:glycoside hydrolase family 35 protein n=1 Tax=Paenibacillus sp. FSL R7-0273 TaxID=1536772 RepID=UPI00063F6E0E|nr:beta-galactosidase [Paenibacillus sp. FSL R7-0273]OMF91194.1 beta-galactosidase [Paenibacillus sp. FSL R7-0273]
MGAASLSRLEWKDHKYLLDGREHRILSGALHYFRIVPEYWADRLLKLKACGFNTVETYIPWNFHEPAEGSFRFDGMADVTGFIKIAGALGLHVIVRPSPYICAEWEFGGLPAWLLKSGMGLRCMDAEYLEKVDRYYDVLIPLLVPLLCTNGGPVVAVQVENEYGSYGNDTAYLEYVRDGLISRGVDCLLFTSDGPTDEMLIGGTVEGLHATVNFGSRVAESFGKYRKYRQDEPLMVMEYWLGWFDHWMQPHHVREAGDVALVLDEMLEQGSSVNLYMFHGGTNFGFYSGANHGEGYEPTVTSYDYDAPLTEWGDPTDKYRAIRQVLGKHGIDAGCPLPEPLPKLAYGRVRLAETADLLKQLDTLAASRTQSVTVQPMEQLDQAYGLILYSTMIKGPRTGQKLHLREVHDRAQVFLDGKLLGIVERWNPLPLELNIPPEGARLDILVENMGRINYGPWLRDPKGITEGVLIDNQFQSNWSIYTLPMEPAVLEQVDYEVSSEEPVILPEERPAFYRGTFDAEAVADTFLRFDGWNKGIAWINGFNLGRYWKAGPQRTLYIPGPLLRKGRNEIVLLELHGPAGDREIVLTDVPDLGESAAVDERVLNFVQEE